MNHPKNGSKKTCGVILFRALQPNPTPKKASEIIICISWSDGVENESADTIIPTIVDKTSDLMISFFLNSNHF